MGGSSKKDSLGYAEPSVMLRQLFRIDHNSDLIAHRSGKAGWFNVFIKYSAPAEPPVPIFVPIVLWTIFTWRYRHSMKPSSRSTRRSAIDATVGFLRYTSIKIFCTSGDGSSGNVTSRRSS